jgi:hypothetical protein
LDQETPSDYWASATSEITVAEMFESNKVPRRRYTSLVRNKFKKATQKKKKILSYEVIHRLKCCSRECLISPLFTNTIYNTLRDFVKTMNQTEFRQWAETEMQLSNDDQVCSHTPNGFQNRT